MSDPNVPTDNPDAAGTAPLDPAATVAGTQSETMPGAADDNDANASDPPESKPLGGEATLAATSWAGASDEELAEE